MQEIVRMLQESIESAKVDWAKIGEEKENDHRHFIPRDKLLHSISTVRHKLVKLSKNINVSDLVKVSSLTLACPGCTVVLASPSRAGVALGPPDASSPRAFTKSEC